MNKIVKGKKALIGLGIAIGVLVLVSVIMGIFLIIWGSAAAVSGKTTVAVFEIIGGAVLILLGFVGIGLSITFIWTGGVIKATDGSIKEGDLCKGTVNMLKCDKCGAEVESGDKNCAECGESLEKEKVCSKCGATCKKQDKKCRKCGEDL